MMWKIKESPLIGDLRIKKSFAFLPIVINGYRIWLREYYEYQIYKEIKNEFHIYHPEYYPAPRRWTTVAYNLYDTDYTLPKFRSKVYHLYNELDKWRNSQIKTNNNLLPISESFSKAVTSIMKYKPKS